MDLELARKPVDRLLPTGIVQQTSFWSRVKTRLGWSPEAYDLLAERDGAADMLIVRRKVGPEASIAYVPYGPEYLPDEERRGLFLERIAEGLRHQLPKDCIFIRFDLPWESPYARAPECFDADGHWTGAPAPAIREVRMNVCTERRALRKGPTDIMPTDTVILDLAPSEEEILGRMKPKTRYNIGLAERKGVRVEEAGLAELPVFYELYGETAGRNGFAHHGIGHFEAALAVKGTPSARTHLLLARRDGAALAGMILAVAGHRATYLYGASANADRGSMAPYALQWAAIRLARQAGADEYDLFGCAPRPDPQHPLFGLWRFKTGFGGTMIHRQGCWDYPLDVEAYEAWRMHEATSAGFHL